MKQDTLFQKLFSNTLDGMLVLEGEKLIDCNETAISLLGYKSRKELIGKTLLELSPDIQEDGEKSVDKALRSIDRCLELGSYRMEWQHKTDVGIKQYFDIVLTTISVEKRLVHCVLRDINEYKKMHFELHEREEMFRIAFDEAPVAMSILSAKGFKFITVNPKFCNLFGFSKKEIIDETIKLVTHPDDEESSNEWIRKKFNDEPCEPLFEKRYIHKDGQIVWGLVSSEWVKDEAGNNRMAITHILDITQIKLAEQELIQHRDHLEQLVKDRTLDLQTANNELQAINEKLTEQRKRLESTLEKLKSTQEQLIESEKMASLGVLTAGLAHEINNPLNFIYNGAAAIETTIDADHPEIKQSLEPLIDAINLGIKRVTDIVKSLGKYSRIEDYPPAKCDIHEIIDGCLTILYNQYKSRIRIKKEYTSTAPIISANEGQLHQVFTNILKNSIQAISNKGEIKISTELTEGFVHIDIADNGEGIIDENIKKVFDPFFTTKDPNQGTGLGLSIAKKIISQHKGTINCESELDSGTKFLIRIPLEL